MKIIDRAQFLRLPEGTIYAKGKKWLFGNIEIKGETTRDGNDWWSLEPCWVDAHDSGQAFDRLEEMISTGAEYPMQNSESRDGMNEPDELFMIFGLEDLKELRGYIDAAIALG
jgi:hypothetical protein